MFNKLLINYFLFYIKGVVFFFSNDNFKNFFDKIKEFFNLRIIMMGIIFLVII